MAYARVFSAQPVYLDARIISVEVDTSHGLHTFSIVGLPDKGVEESKERVSAAIKNSGYESPKQNNIKVVISLAPSDIKKEGPRFDLPIALAYLISKKVCKNPTEDTLFVGELSLEGKIRPVSGVLSLVRTALKNNFRTIIVPKENAEEAALVRGISVLPAESLKQVVAHFEENSLEKISPQNATEYTSFSSKEEKEYTDFKDIYGQDTAKRGLEIAAAGRHNIALYGPPGTGKTLLARALQSILPPLSFEEALETTAIHSIAGTLTSSFITRPPFRSPHHSSSYVALIGGGAIPKPGEITLSHRGVLFLDEFPEFDRRVIDVLREPLEEGTVSIARAKGSVVFPANSMLIAALNPNRDKGENRISEYEREKLKKKISGPVIDRIDMWIEVAHIPHSALKIERNEKEKPLLSPSIRERVLRARNIQKERFKKEGKTNRDMTVKEVQKYIFLKESAENILQNAAHHYSLSPRSYHRSLKLARTIADLAEKEYIEDEHILEALTYRPKGLFE